MKRILTLVLFLASASVSWAYGIAVVIGDGMVDTQDVLEIYKYIQEHYNGRPTLTPPLWGEPAEELYTITQHNRTGIAPSPVDIYNTLLPILGYGDMYVPMR